MMFRFFYCWQKPQTQVVAIQRDQYCLILDVNGLEK